jgi:hypothetical protein
MLERLTGRRLLQLPLWVGPMRLAGRIVDSINRFVPIETPLGAEAVEYATNWVKLDNSKVERSLDFDFRPVEQTMAETISWLYRDGHISARQAGMLAIN